LDNSITDIASAIEKLTTAVVGRANLRNELLMCPVVSPTKVIAIGLNYLDHIRETGLPKPSQPVVFAKFPNALSGPRDVIDVPASLTSEADYEIELAVVIGQPCRSVTAANALGYVFGYAVANDISPRDLQRRDPQLSWAKSVDGFCPLGPWITTADEVRDPQSLAITASVNGELRQSSSTGEMVFSIAELIEHLSQTMTLMPGDVILTGTPHGVGFSMKPPKFLSDGDLVRGEIQQLGFIENQIRSS
jgi:2-keto-4-pentenoate hydratase/2-oxohepta-3-ene-1,7-dioic acid hydratase in catechol pathway